MQEPGRRTVPDSVHVLQAYQRAASFTFMRRDRQRRQASRTFLGALVLEAIWKRDLSSERRSTVCLTKFSPLRC